MVSHPFRLLIFAVASICILTALPVLTNAANSGDRVAVVVSSGDTGGAPTKRYPISVPIASLARSQV